MRGHNHCIRTSRRADSLTTKIGSWTLCIIIAFALDISRIGTSSFSLPLQQVAGTCDLFSPTWRWMHLMWRYRPRRTGHVAPPNGAHQWQKFGVSQKDRRQRSEFRTGRVAWDVYIVGKSTQQGHPKTASIDIDQPFECWGPSHGLHWEASST